MHRHAKLEHANDQATENIDEGNHDAGNRIPLDKFTRTIHSSVEVRFPLQISSPSSCLYVIDKTGIEIGIHRHLLAGHGIKRKTGRNLRHTPRTIGDDHKLNDRNDNENYQAHHIIAANDKGAKGADDLPRLPSR